MATIKVLSIIDTAYRATLEEQDDTVVWFTHILCQSGADITILLTGNAVNYAVCGQAPPPLTFGAAAIAHPPRLDRDLWQAREAGVKLALVRDDADLRGIPATMLMPEVELISRDQLAEFINGFDRVWHW